MEIIKTQQAIISLNEISDKFDIKILEVDRIDDGEITFKLEDVK